MQQGRNYKGMLPAAESLPNRHHHHLASQAHMDDAAKEQIGGSTKKHRSCFGFIIEIILSPFRTKRIRGDNSHMKVFSKRLHMSTYIDILKMKSGRDDIHEGNLVQAICDIFGEDVSPDFKNLCESPWGRW